MFLHAHADMVSRLCGFLRATTVGTLSCLKFSRKPSCRSDSRNDWRKRKRRPLHWGDCRFIWIYDSREMFMASEAVFEL